MIDKYVKRLTKIGVKIELMGNFPWVYLTKVNGKKVKGTFLANHGFTAFTLGMQENEVKTHDRRALFKKIRETLEA